MIIAVLIVLAFDVLMTAWLGWAALHENKVPLPSFAKEARCVRCDNVIDDDEKTVDVYMRASVGDKQLPVTALICEECVSLA